MRLQLFPFDFRMCTALASHQMFCMPSWKCVVRLSELDGEIAISEKHKKSSGLFRKDRHSVTELEFRPGSYFSSIKAFQEKGD